VRHVDAWVGELIVDERYEGQGIARALIAVVEDWANARGLTHVRLSTGAANHGARAFYERIGYGLNEVTLTRDLRAASFT
jgi:GNAT superfamily N-acetyltransferase